MPDRNLPFLGTGWHFPPTFTAGGGEVLMATGVEDIQQSLQILLSTAQGERIMQEKFGCDLNHFVFEEVDQSLFNSLTSLIEDAILYHERRIKLDRVDIIVSKDIAKLLLISIHYTVRSTNSRYNMVYPFYLDDATNPAS